MRMLNAPELTGSAVAVVPYDKGAEPIEFLVLIFICACIAFLAVAVSAIRATYFYARGDPIEEHRTTLLKWAGFLGLALLLWFYAYDCGWL